MCRGGRGGLLSLPDVRGNKVNQLRRHCNHLGRGVTARTQLIEERPSEDLGGLRVSAHRAGTDCHTRATTFHHCKYMKSLDPSSRPRLLGCEGHCALPTGCAAPRRSASTLPPLDRLAAAPGFLTP